MTSLKSRIASSPAANRQFKEMDNVEIAGFRFPVFGSVSWTVAALRQRGWEEVRAAYVSITGDERDNVDRDRASDVVAGELQQAWAKLVGRDDALPRLEANQRRRVEIALQSTAAVTAATKDRTRTRRAPETKQSGGGDMAEGTKKLPSRGSMGYAVELMNAGERDEKALVAKVQEKFPNGKHTARSVRWVARQAGVELQRPVKAKAETGSAE